MGVTAVSTPKRGQNEARTTRRRRHRVGECPSIPTPCRSSRNSKALRSSICERALGGVNIGAVQPRRHASTMLLLFVGVMVQELLLLAEASPLRSTHGRGRHHHCARLSDACAQQNALAEQRHFLLHGAHRVSPSFFRGARGRLLVLPERDQRAPRAAGG